MRPSAASSCRARTSDARHGHGRRPRKAKARAPPRLATGARRRGLMIAQVAVIRGTCRTSRARCADRDGRGLGHRRADAQGRAVRVDEGEFQELTFGICDPDIEEGEWIYVDVVQHAARAPRTTPRAARTTTRTRRRRRRRRAGASRSRSRARRRVPARVPHDRCSVFEHREDLAETLWKRDPNTKEKLTSRVCTKWRRSARRSRAGRPRAAGVRRVVGDEAEGLSSPSGAAVRRAMVPDGRGLVQDEAHAVADQPHDREARPAARAVRRPV